MREKIIILIYERDQLYKGLWKGKRFYMEFKKNGDIK